LSTSGHSHWLRTVQIVSLTQVAILIGFNFSFPFLPLFIQELGVHDRAQLALWTGISVGAGGIAMALISPVWGYLADRLGRKAMLVRSVAGGSIVMAIQAATSSVWQLVAVRVAQGAFTGTQTAGAMLLAGVVPPQRTGFALGLLNTAVQVGNLIGPVLGGFVVVAIGLRSSFLVGAALLAVCAVVTVALVDDSPRPARETLPVGTREIARDLARPFAWPGLRGVLIVSGGLQIVSSGTAAMLAIYVQDLARPAWLSTELAVGLALTLGALAAAATMPFLGSWADRHDPRTLLIASLAVLSVSLVPQVLFPTAVVFLPLRLGVGLGLAGATSAISVLTRMGAPLGYEGRAFGTLAAVQNMGWGVGPLVGSLIAAFAGVPALYLAGSVALVVLLIATALSREWFAAPALEQEAGLVGP
jgi:DHA1 family multidrug resistance protein-like MFS transporter